MKKALMLMLHRAPDGGTVKDGGPALTREITHALERHDYTVEYMSGNTMRPEKQHTDLSPFFQRIAKAKDFADEIDKNIFNTYDLILVMHPSTLMGFEAKELPLEKLFLFPTLLGKEYAYFMDVPEQYFELEKKILNYGYWIQCPSQTQAHVLQKEYSVPKKNIFIKPRGFSPKLFPSNERTLRTNISQNNPLRIVSANAVRPQKGYMDLIPLVKKCAEHKLPIKIIIYGDTIQSTNKLYLAYAQNFITEIKNQNLESYFEFHEACNQETLSIEMETCDMAIVPSIYETFGKSALESSASGLPTIVFNDVLAYREFLDDSSAIFCSRNPLDFYTTISSILFNPDRYHKLSLNGIKNGEKYISFQIYDDLIDSIEERLPKSTTTTSTHLYKI